MLTRGDVLGGRYRLDEPIATGGMGEVWRATDQTLRRTVALKVLRTTLLADPVFDARFRAEARTMAALNHPNVVNIYDYGRSPVPEGDATYLVMAHVDGQPLSALITQTDGLPVGRTLAVLAQAADALHAAHAHGIVHRDVKPANLLVRPDGTVVLVDFGVARSAELSTATTGNQVLGTALYMAPEQAAGRGVSPATDIYALGVVGYHCLTGQPPFTGETPVEVALRHISDPPPPLPSSIPRAVRSLVLRALAKDPADRFPDAAAFATAARAAARTAGDARLAGAGQRSPAGRRTAVVAAPVGPGPATVGTALPVDPPTLAEPQAIPVVAPVPLANQPQPGRGRRGAAVLACLLAIGVLAGVLGLLLHGGSPAGGGPAPADRPATVRPASPGTGAQPANGTGGTGGTTGTTGTAVTPTGPGSAAATVNNPGAPAAATTPANPPASTPPPTQAPSRPPATSPAPATSSAPSPPPSTAPTADVGTTTAPSVAAIPGATAAGSGSAMTASNSDSASASGSNSASASGSNSASASGDNASSPAH